MGDSREWDSESDRNFTVYFDSQDRNIAFQVLSIASSFFPFSRSLRPDVLSRQIHIYIAPSQEEFDRLTAGTIPHWGTACAIPNRSLIVLKSPRIMQVWREKLQVVLRHELVHIYLHRIAIGGVPRWYDEGLAIYYSGEWDLRNNLDLAIAVVTGGLIPLREMRVSYPDAEQRVNLFYLESYSAAAFLNSYLGRERSPLFFHRLLTTENFERALYQQTGMTLDRFETMWEGWLERNYHPLYLIGRTEFLFTLLLIILVVAYITKRRRFRRKIAEIDSLEGEEEYTGKNP